MIPTMMVPNTNLRHAQVNIPISQRVEEERTYYKDKNEPLEGKYKKGYTFHLSEKEIIDLLELKKELELRVNKEREEKEKENNERAIGKDLVLSPSITEEGENIVINTKTNEIGKITKLHNDEVNQKDTEEEEDEKKEIDNNDIIKLAKNMTTPILPKYKNIKESNYVEKDLSHLRQARPLPTGISWQSQSHRRDIGGKAQAHARVLHR